MTIKLYTKTGDDGSTGLAGGERQGKDSARVEACGSVDALNSAIGLAAAASQHSELSACLQLIQNRLFELGTDLMTLCGPDTQTAARPEIRIRADEVVEVEQTIDRVSEKLAPMNSFILPGGSELAARLHVARTACRLAERRVVALSREEKVNRHILIYLNRLSDLLFAMARWANQLEGVQDIPWTGGQRTETLD